jgi:hypothetical protein
MLGDIGDTIFSMVAMAVAVGLVVNAAVLAGALVATVRHDHRNPVSMQGLEWYQHHWDRSHPSGYE